MTTARPLYPHPTLSGLSQFVDADLMQICGLTSVNDLTITLAAAKSLNINAGKFTVAGDTGNLMITQAVSTSGASKGLVFTGAANTGQTATTEIPSVTITPSSRNWASSGTLARQAEVRIDQPSYSFTTAGTITDAATLCVIGAPQRVTLGTITNSHGLLVQSAAVGTVTNSYGLTINAQTGATNNYGAQIVGGSGTVGAVLKVTQAAASAGAVHGLLYTGVVTTGQTLSTEINSALFTTAGRQWATGAIGTQREVLITQPTYSFVGGSTITDSATLAIIGAPKASTNATLTNTHGLWIQSGTVSGGTATTNSYGLTVNAQAGATNNYAAQFVGNVGINTAAPGSALDVKGTLRLSGATSGFVGLQGAAAAGGTTYTLPATAGTDGYALTTDGSGTLRWAAAAVDLSTAVLLAGRAGGQIVKGGTAANNTLVLQGNSAASGNTLTNLAIEMKVGNSGISALTILNNGQVTLNPGAAPAPPALVLDVPPLGSFGKSNSPVLQWVARGYDGGVVDNKWAVEVNGLQEGMAVTEWQLSAHWSGDVKRRVVAITTDEGGMTGAYALGGDYSDWNFGPERPINNGNGAHLWIDSGPFRVSGVNGDLKIGTIVSTNLTLGKASGSLAFFGGTPVALNGALTTNNGSLATDLPSGATLGQIEAFLRKLVWILGDLSGSAGLCLVHVTS